MSNLNSSPWISHHKWVSPHTFTCDWLLVWCWSHIDLSVCFSSPFLFMRECPTSSSYPGVMMSEKWTLQNLGETKFEDVETKSFLIAIILASHDTLDLHIAWCPSRFSSFSICFLRSHDPLGLWNMQNISPLSLLDWPMRPSSTRKRGIRNLQ